MKKLLLSLCVVSLVGCSQSTPATYKEALKQQQKEEASQMLDVNSVKLSDYSDLETSGQTLEFDWEYDIAEKYGTQGFKAMTLCYDKHLSKLDGVDTSSDFGAVKQDEVLALIESCSHNSLVYTTEIPEDKRTHIPRDEPANYGLELDETEVEGFNDIPPMFQPDVNDPRYKEVYARCAINNQEIVDPVEFASAVDFCTAKGM